MIRNFYRYQEISIDCKEFRVFEKITTNLIRYTIFKGFQRNLQDFKKVYRI